MTRLVMSAAPARDCFPGGAVPLRDVRDEGDLAWAEANGSYVYLLDEQTGGPGKVLFDGSEWLVPRPTYDPAPDFAVPSVDYVDERTEVMQSELEAIVGVVATAVADRVPARTISALRDRVSTARIAMSDGDSIAMAKVATVLSDTPDTPIFTVERALEVTDAGTER